MSVQFGKCNFAGKPIDREDLDEVRPVLAPYGPDAEGLICKDNFAVLYRAFHTTSESLRESQPHVMPSGDVLMWDGRLDNREEMVRELAPGISAQSTDVEIVAAAYECWRTRSFARFVGEWALSIWDARTQTLVLAKDFVGTRHLYYSVKGDEISWCTILDPLVLFAGHSFEVDREYVAGWLSFFPATQLTPYSGIHAVPPSSFVRLALGKQKIEKYWDFDPSKSVRYRNDREYEEHFRSAFSGAVRRRLRSNNPILAELSGGMDSSSIVCVADDLIANGETGPIDLHTVSYCDETEPNWNERPYLTKVEERRGRVGWHMDVSSQMFFTVGRTDHTFFASPSGCGASEETQRELARCMASRRSRVLLSGIAGDEIAGGVPTPLPELEDLLARARLRLITRLKAWALIDRRPWTHLLWEVICAFMPGGVAGVPAYKAPAPWLEPGFIRRHKTALAGYESRLKLFGPLPSFQENILALEALRRQLSCENPSPSPIFEKAYPYLDRDLLEFIYAIPREQLVRPGQRRSLMRRALKGTVPEEVLNRRRKAYVARSPLLAISLQYDNLRKLCERLLTSTLGIVNTEALLAAFERARLGHEIPIVLMARVLCVELWLRSATDFLIFPDGSPLARPCWSPDSSHSLELKRIRLAS